MGMTRGNIDKRNGSEQYHGAVKRFLRMYGKNARMGNLDITALEQLRDLHRELDQQTAEVVAALRSPEDGSTPASWAEIARGLGVTRASAQQRYGHLDGANVRKRGGQPAALR